MSGQLWIRGAVILGVAVVGIQFMPVDRTNPPVTSEVPAPPEVKAILRRACYDCHSHETRWPWYSYVAPVSWFLADHIHEAREELNLSAWSLNPEDAADDREEMWHEVEEGDMPLRSYVWLHRDARLSAEDKEILRRWAMR